MRNRLLGVCIAILFLVIGSVLISPLKDWLDLSNIALLYVLAVVFVGVRFGRQVTTVFGLAGSIAFAYVFVPPHFSLYITDWQNLLTAGIMLVVAVIIGHLTAELRAYADSVELRAQHSKALCDFAQALAGADSSNSVEAATLLFFVDTLHAIAPQFLVSEAVLSSNVSGLPEAMKQGLVLQKMVVWQDSGLSYVNVIVPIVASTGVHAFLKFHCPTSFVRTESYDELVETAATLVAVALERTHFAEMARESELKHNAQSLRLTILSALSHDIRTPLTSLVGTADLLTHNETIAPDTRGRLLGSLREQALSIRQLVSNLLDMARLQSGKVDLNLVWQPVEELIEATLAQAREVMRDREVNVEIEAMLPPLKFDAVLMERALWNLIENACKYSPVSESVLVSVKRIGEWVDIAVHDRGKGLPEGGGESIFGLFQRGVTESSIPGVGLGLSIAKNVAVANGGRLTAENREGGGSTFHLMLPILDGGPKFSEEN